MEIGDLSRNKTFLSSLNNGNIPDGRQNKEYHGDGDDPVPCVGNQIQLTSEITFQCKCLLFHRVGVPGK